MAKNKKKASPKLPRFRATKRMTSVKFLSRRDKMRFQRIKRVDEDEQ